MKQQGLPQENIALIPWILAIVALFGVHIINEKDFRRIRDDTADGACLSAVSQDLVTTGRVSDPLVYGSPSSAMDTIPCSNGAMFLELGTDQVFLSSCKRDGETLGRAPPIEV